jgi:hypothetical protein
MPEPFKNPPKFTAQYLVMAFARLEMMNGTEIEECFLNAEEELAGFLAKGQKDPTSLYANYVNQKDGIVAGLEHVKAMYMVEP